MLAHVEAGDCFDIGHDRRGTARTRVGGAGLADSDGGRLVSGGGGVVGPDPGGQHWCELDRGVEHLGARHGDGTAAGAGLCENRHGGAGEVASTGHQGQGVERLHDRGVGRNSGRGGDARVVGGSTRGQAQGGVIGEVVSSRHGRSALRCVDDHIDGVGARWRGGGDRVDRVHQHAGGSHTTEHHGGITGEAGAVDGHRGAAAGRTGCRVGHGANARDRRG